MTYDDIDPDGDGVIDSDGMVSGGTRDVSPETTLDLASEVQSALSNNKTHIVVHKPEDESGYTWEQDIVVDTDANPDFELDIKQGVDIEYQNSGWALTLGQISSSITDAYLPTVDGGAWTKSSGATPSGWVRIRDTYGCQISAESVHFDGVGEAVALENHESWTERTKISDFHAVTDIGIMMRPASVTGGGGTDSFHETTIDNVTLRAASEGLHTDGNCDALRIRDCTFRPDADGANHIVYDHDFARGGYEIGSKHEDVVGYANVNAYDEPNDALFYGPYIVDSRTITGTISLTTSSVGDNFIYTTSEGNKAFEIKNPSGADPTDWKFHTGGNDRGAFEIDRTGQGVSARFELTDSEEIELQTPFIAKHTDHIYNASWYGSDLAAIQSAVDDANAAGGGTVWVPKAAGPYPANSTVLDVPSGIRIVSDGAHITAGTKDVAGGTTEVVRNADQTNGNSNIIIEGLVITGKINFVADAANGNYNDDVVLEDITCLDVPDFAFDLDDCKDTLVKNCYVSNSGVGTDDNGNDAYHLTDCIDCELENCDADSGDDVVAIESNATATERITVDGTTGSSNIGDLIKIYTHPDTTTGDDIRHVTVRDVKTEGGGGDGIEFENDGSGIIENVTFDGVQISDVERGLISNDYTNVRNITLQSCTIERTLQGAAVLGNGWEAYGCTFGPAGLSGNAYQCVTINAPDVNIIGGNIGTSTNHVLYAGGARFTVQDVTIDATAKTIDATTISPEQGIRSAAPNGRIQGNRIDADQNWAIGSNGSDPGTVVKNNTTLTNGIGDAQFSSDAIIGDGLIDAAGYDRGDFMPLLYGSGVNTSDDDTTSSTYSAARNGGDMIVQWDTIGPANGQLSVAYFGRVDLLNGSTMNVRVYNVTDGETVVERTGISSTGPFSIQPTTYTPTTTSNAIRLEAQIASTDGTNTVRLDDGSPTIGVQL